MFIEMLDVLRCVNSHEDTWLVASLKAISNRFVLDGTLGCPVCHAEYSIKKGVADFRQAGDSAAALSDRPPDRETREELATRLGAFLNATEPGATIVLGGRWADAARELSTMTESRVLVLNPRPSVEESETVGLLLVSSEIPLAPGSVQGVAVDESFAVEILASVVRVLRPGGRVVGPVAAEPPAELALLARDDINWVAEKAAEMIPLRRAEAATLP
jgi:hypothetical protein